MNETLSIGESFVEMPGSTFRKEWEIIGIDGDRVTVKLIDRAVGYAAGETDEFDREALAKSVEDGVLTGQIVKTIPDTGTRIVP